MSARANPAFYRSAAPREKLRGRKRYFARVQQKAEAVSFDPGPDSWWELWHYHADRRGWGNLGWRHRRPHVVALCTVFRKICAVQRRFATPFQSWIILDGEDAGQDAVYLHTPNPNRNHFPIRLDDASKVEWGTSAMLPVMRALLPNLEIEVGWTANEDEDGRRTSHWIQAKGVGVSLRAD